MAWLEVVQTGALTTVQDRGRPGNAAIGVGESGAADRESHDAANRLVGNRIDAATLEATVGGLSLRSVGATCISVTGARSCPTVNSLPVPDYSTLHLQTGDLLEIGYPTTGLRTYVAARGGIDVPPVLGSRSTDTLAGLGPSPVKVGDQLLVGTDMLGWPAEDFIPPPAEPENPVWLRVRLGPRDNWFTPASVHALLEQRWWVTTDTNRIGAKLDGQGPLHRRKRDELPTEGMVAGALQVPPSGKPILFLADHPPTGGYPVIAVVDTEDLPVAAQLRPGHHIRFVPDTAQR
ncbi:biotin-dependent carboxyltransferase family protein [Rhodococcus sp. NPDC058521]|uniref:5-oxoprolinase subunit C family protein n=1 Tax=Rhodococcus sp. NPDC058521 TaxID=3346536 RepID=UPI0036660F84